jgi:tetratricopeptide (TPR) repeat protein
MTSIGRVPFGIGLLVLAAFAAGPGDAQTQSLSHFRQGLAASKLGDYDTAIREYTLAIDAGDLPYPDSFFVFNNRGNAYAAKRDWDHAVQDYSEALRRNPKFAAARRNRGLLYSRKGDPELAIQDFTEAAQLDPDDPHALIYRAVVYCEKRELERSLRDFDAALVLCPTCPGAMSGRAAAAAGRDCR